MRAITLLSVLFMIGCDSPAPPPIRTEVWNLFPFDGQRTWRYVNDKAPYNIAAELIDSEALPNVNVYAVSFTKLCRFEGKSCVTGDEILNIRWSSDPTLGVRIHAYTFEDFVVPMQPPMQITEDTAVSGEDSITTIDGVQWTSTFEGIFTCPSTQSNDWQCGLFEVVAAPEEDGSPLAGSYYAARGQGLVAFDLAMDDYGLWQDGGTTCKGDCNGSW